LPVGMACFAFWAVFPDFLVFCGAGFFKSFSAIWVRELLARYLSAILSPASRTAPMPTDWMPALPTNVLRETKIHLQTPHPMNTTVRM